MKRFGGDGVAVIFLVWFLIVGLAAVLFNAIHASKGDKRCDRLEALAAEGNQLAAVEAVKRGC